MAKGAAKPAPSVRTILDGRSASVKKVEQLLKVVVGMYKGNEAAKQFSEKHPEVPVNPLLATELKNSARDIGLVVKAVLTTKNRSVTSIIADEFREFVVIIADHLKTYSGKGDYPTIFTNNDYKDFVKAVQDGRPVLKQLVRTMINLWTNIFGIHQKESFVIGEGTSKKTVTKNHYASTKSDESEGFASQFVIPALEALAKKKGITYNALLDTLGNGKEVSAAIASADLVDEYTQLKIKLTLPSQTGSKLAFDFPTRVLTSLTSVLFDSKTYKEQVKASIDEAGKDKERRANIRAEQKAELAKLSNQQNVMNECMRRVLVYVNKFM